jgi:hypothetical protein
MLMGLAQTFGRFFAALVCVVSLSGLSASGALDASLVASRSASEDLLSAGVQSDELEATSESPDSRSEREEREDDDEDDDIDDSQHMPAFAFPSPEPLFALAPFPRALSHSAPQRGHHSLDPRPPRHA